MSRTLRPADPVEAAVGCVAGASRTTVVVSPVSITSVAIRTAPITSTIRPPSTPARRLVSGMLVVMYGGLVRRPYGSINVKVRCGPSRTRRARREGDQAAQPVDEAAASELPAHHPALAQARRVRGARAWRAPPRRRRAARPRAGGTAA